ncbi:translation initiation factor IF-2-like [Vidua chalybeata]|uniref:translation initiation factor IF-2-like n=1 Tax=Vidua chalybeata TaxID=81927 RepID=UPI0023A89D81|nr:translation initiation factor IF-2-like [Vidua chalybeata]
MAFLQRKRTLRLSPSTCHLFQTQPGLCNPAAQPHAPKLSQRTPHGPGQPQHVAPEGDYQATGKASQGARGLLTSGPLQGPGSPGKRHQHAQSPTSRPTGERHSWALLPTPAPPPAGRRRPREEGDPADCYPRPRAPRRPSGPGRAVIGRIPTPRCRGGPRSPPGPSRKKGRRALRTHRESAAAKPRRTFRILARGARAGTCAVPWGCPPVPPQPLALRAAGGKETEGKPPLLGSASSSYAEPSPWAAPAASLRQNSRLLVSKCRSCEEPLECRHWHRGALGLRGSACAAELPLPLSRQGCQDGSSHRSNSSGRVDGVFPRPLRCTIPRAARGDRGTCLSRDNQNPPGHVPVSPAPADPAMADDVQRSLPTVTTLRFREGASPHFRGLLGAGLSWNTRSWSLDSRMRTSLTTLFSSSLSGVLNTSAHLRRLLCLLANGASRTRWLVQSRCDLIHLMPHPQNNS